MFEESIPCLSRAVMIRPDSAKARNSLGVSLASRGKIAEAVGHFREALRLDPGNVQARANLEDALRGWR
jgi:Flp pilus assembly protein TadD